MSDRLEKLEMQIAFLERQYDQLNQVVIDQSRVIARLQAELSRNSEALTGIELERIRSVTQKPPHYQ